MKLVVGLGNPGKQYENTRHNIGFMLLDKYSQIHNISIDKEKFGGLYAIETLYGEKVLFLKPQEYINLSGDVLKRFVDYYDIAIEDILIINDDLDLEIGTFKLKPGGSSAGHNGLKNIEFNLKTKDYKRLKIGISNNKQIDTKDYVLGKLNNYEKESINTVMDECVMLLDDYFKMSFNDLMNKYNSKTK